MIFAAVLPAMEAGIIVLDRCDLDPNDFGESSVAEDDPAGERGLPGLPGCGPDEDQIFFMKHHRRGMSLIGGMNRNLKSFAVKSSYLFVFRSGGIPHSYRRASIGSSLDALRAG
jgi:hypothetical protein